MLRASLGAFVFVVACAGTPRDEAGHGSPGGPGLAAAQEAGASDRRPTGGVLLGHLARVQRAIQRFAADRAGRLPVTLDELTTERSPEGDRYLSSLPTDPWGRRYAYAVVSARLGAYDLRSYGPDTLPGTSDDVVADAPTVPVR